MFEDSSMNVLLALLATCTWKHLALGAISSLFFIRRRKKEYAGRISRVTGYPVKSMKGIEVNSADCEYTGFVGHLNGATLKDRSWMVITQTGVVVTARNKPRMVLIDTSYHDDWLHLNAPGMEVIRIPLDLKLSDGKLCQTKVWGMPVEGIDCGDAVAEWISTFLEIPGLRLLFHAQGTANQKLASGPSKWHKAAKDVDQIAFQDGFPFMMISESSIRDLNRRLENKVKTDQFRPNFVITTDLPAFDEDDWLELFIGDAIFHNIKPCDRCLMTIIDPETGTTSADKEPLMTLRSYRLTDPEFGQAPCMGINLVLIQPGTVRLGDEVYITRKPKPNQSD